MFYLCFGKGDSFPHFPEHGTVFSVRIGSLIKAFFQGTLFQVRAAVADVRRPGKPGAFFLHEIRADRGTLFAGPAVTSAVAGGAQSAPVTAEAQSTVVECPAMGPSLFENLMGTDFL